MSDQLERNGAAGSVGSVIPTPGGMTQDYHMARWFPQAGGGLGAWVYCCLYQKRYWPIGYCSLRCGHRTPAEAAEHYREYLLDEATYDGRWAGVSYECEVCGDWTDRFAQLKSAFQIHRLCSSHMNRGGLSRVLTIAESEE